MIIYLKIADLLKEYLRELPEPVFSNCLYQMLVDAVGVFFPDDPVGNTKLVFSILGEDKFGIEKTENTMIIDDLF